MGSFKGAMQAAQARLKGLHATASKIGGFFKKLALGVVGLSAAFAGFAATKIFGNIFKDAVKQAQEAEDRTRTLTASLLRIEGIRRKGVGFAKEQVDLLQKYNAAMSKQGVVSSDMFDIAAKTLSIYKVTPKKIAEMQGPLADALISIKGARATEEDMQGLALATGKAIRGGKVRALEEYGFVLNKQATKEFRDAKSMEGRRRTLLKYFQGFAGQNKKALNTATGQIQKLHEEQKKLSEELGVKMLPAMGKMAQAWRKLLPEAKPFLEAIQNLRIKGMEWLANFIRSDLIPAWKSFSKTVSASGAWDRLRGAWNKLTKSFGETFQIKNAEDWGKKIGDAFVYVLDKLTGLVDYVSANKDWLLPLIKNTTKLAIALAVIGKVSKTTAPAISGLMSAFKLGKALVPLLAAIGPTGWIIIGIVALVAALVWVATHWTKFKEIVQKTWDTLGKVPVIGPLLQLTMVPMRLLIKLIDYLISLPWADWWNTARDAVERFDAFLQPWVDTVTKNFVQAWTDMFDNLKKAWDTLKHFFTGQIDWGAVFKPLTDAFSNAVEWMKTKWNNFATSLHLPSFMKFGGGKAAAAAQEWTTGAGHIAAQNIPTNETMLPNYQHGGVVTRPMIARIGETPELIVPLKVLGKTMNQVTEAVKEVADTLRRQLLEPMKQAATGLGMRGGFLGVGGGRAAGMAGAAAAAGIAPMGAVAAAKAVVLSPEAIAKIQSERMEAVKQLQAPEMQNLVSATLATEASTAEGQKNVLEAMVNRAVAYKRAGKFVSMEHMIKGGFYGPYNRGETRAVMGRGLSEARRQQVAGMVSEIGAGRNVLRGMTDQGMVNEIKGHKERIAGEYYGFMEGLHNQYSTAAFAESKKAAAGAPPPMLAAATPGAQFGGIFRRPSLTRIAERGRPEAVIPLTGGHRAHGLLDYAARALGRGPLGGRGGTTHHVAFAPHIEIHGNVTHEETRAMDSRLRDLAKDFISQFKRAQHQERRLSYDSGYS